MSPFNPLSLEQRLRILTSREEALLELFGLPRCWQDVEHEDWPADPLAGWFGIFSDNAMLAARNAGHDFRWHAGTRTPMLTVFPCIRFDAMTVCFEKQGYNRKTKKIGWDTEPSEMGDRPTPDPDILAGLMKNLERRPLRQRDRKPVKGA